MPINDKFVIQSFITLYMDQTQGSYLITERNYLQKSKEIRPDLVTLDINMTFNFLLSSINTDIDSSINMV